MNFKKLQTKILAGYIIIVLIFGVIAGISFFQLEGMNKAVDQLTQVEFAKFKINAQLTYNLSERASLLRAYMLYKKPNYLESFDNLTKASNELEKQLLSMSGTQEEKDTMARSAKWSSLIRGPIVAAVDSNNTEEVNRLAGQAAPETAALIEIYNGMTAKSDNRIIELAKQMDKTQTTIIVILFTSTAIAAVLALILGIVAARSITKPVAKLVRVSEKIAEGDLDVDIEVSGRDEIGMLAKAFTNMNNNLNDVMSNIASAAEQVASGSKQISDSSMALSQGATEQASSIEELTASLEEISAQTVQNADHANQANNLAETSKSNAIKGNTQMKDMLKAMDEINDSSSSISKIIKVIDEIAFQTNILALNAAVEAARAGQHGKGFAVVAEEVRNLAARSANAAKETTDMIEGSIKKVEEGTKIANQTAEALNEIVEGISKVAVLVEDIATASNEQAAGIAQINQGIMQVSEVVQTNSATSEEGAAASEELAGQAELLKEQVSKFKLRRTYRSGSSYSGLEDLNPEVLKMLEKMNDKKKAAKSNEDVEAAGVTKKIALSDNEFGKY